MHKDLLKFYCFLLISLCASPLYAQRMEAENAALAGGAKKVASENASGGFYVAQEEGSLSFTVNVEETGFYSLYLMASAPNGEKTNIIAIGDVSADFFLERSSQFKQIKVVNTHRITAGEHKVAIHKSWGWINIDYLELEKVDASSRFNLNQSLVTPDPTPEATALFDFLLDSYGEKIISGVMTLNSMDESNWLKANTVKEPALLGIDFMHSGRNYDWYDDKEPVKDAQSWYSRNGIPALMWHWRDPSRKTEEFYSDGTNFDISKINDENSAEYKAMLSDIDYISGLLKELQEAGVPVIWRPLHEAAGGWFWWGAKGGAPLKALWQLMFDRMVNHHRLHNLIWVWTREPGDDDWYPGDEYVDIVGRDIYKEGNHSSHAIEFNNMNALYGGKKMVTLSEVGSFPDPDHLLEDGAAWSWFMPWYGDHTRLSRYNPLDLWIKTLNHDYVITLDEMPELRNYKRQGQTPAPEPQPEPTGIEDELAEKGFIAYPTVVEDNLTIVSNQKIKMIAVYSTLGKVVRLQWGNGNKEIVSLSGLHAGIYIVRINGANSFRLIKR